MSLFDNIASAGLKPIDLLKSIIDILIVYYLVYRVLLVFKGTRALQMVIGVFMVFAVYVVSKFIGFFTLSWLLDNFFSSLFLVLVVLFQQDIRRALSTIGGKTQFSTMVRTVEEAKIIDEIIHAVSVFHQKKTGALIVVERDASVKEFCNFEKATRLDCLVSSELLRNIFYVGAPLHDGAVLIQQGKLSYAAILLPMSANPRNSRELGTRHRAAIGITEETDAVAIVVSEETGKISCCIEGKITRDLEPETLRKMLLNLLGGEALAQDKKDKAAKKIQKALEAAAGKAGKRGREKTFSPTQTQSMQKFSPKDTQTIRKAK